MADAAKPQKKPHFSKENARANALKGNAKRWANFAARLATVASRGQPLALQQVATSVDSTASNTARTMLISEVETQIRMLAAQPPARLSALGNGPDGEGRASLVKRLVDTAAQLHGWGSTSGTSMVVVGLVSALDPDESRPAPGNEPAIEV